SDLLNITGDAHLNGGTLNIIAEPGDYVPTTYTIITTGGNVLGTFADTVIGDTNLTGTVNYFSQSVNLVLSASDIVVINSLNAFNTPTYSESMPYVLQKNLNEKYNILVQELGNLPVYLAVGNDLWITGYKGY